MVKKTLVPIRIEFVATNDIPAKIIQAFTWSWCDHVQFVLDGGVRVGAMPGAGVELGLPPPPTARTEIYEVKAPAEVIYFAVAQVGKPYDWDALLGMPFRKDWRDPSKWFCSELVTAAFEAGGHPILRSDHVDRVTPRDVLMSPLLKRVG